MEEDQKAEVGQRKTPRKTIFYAKQVPDEGLHTPP